MVTMMDAAGRLVIPKAIRRQAGWAPGLPLEVRWHDGQIEITPAPVAVRLERRGRLVVAVPTEPLLPLTVTEVEQTRATLDDERV